MNEMLHDIPGAFANHYYERKATPDDFVLVFRDNTLLMCRQDNDVELPTFSLLDAVDAATCTYLFDIDGRGFFLASEEDASCATADNSHGGIDAGQVDETPSCAGFSFQSLRDSRRMRPRAARFAIEVASQLVHWYRDNRFCGRCGKELVPDHKERMMRCEHCGNHVYPRINPGVIVGVVDGDRLLLTKYAGNGYTNWALVAGFTEIGETLEQTVAREVMEETGVRVKNIRYFTNQPWPKSSSLLVGYFAELDGDPTVSLDDHELSRAEWVPWNEVPHKPDGYSMTRAMMCAFHDHFAQREESH